MEQIHASIHYPAPRSAHNSASISARSERNSDTGATLDIHRKFLARVAATYRKMAIGGHDLIEMALVSGREQLRLVGDNGMCKPGHGNSPIFGTIYCSHPRRIYLEWQDGRTARIHLDKGLEVGRSLNRLHRDLMLVKTLSSRRVSLRGLF
ncbi:hypothetical protein [Oceaniglobus indicus]|uniref:hypothetical protein n=1 Tax=Oceaniglobus indicus TaxID=2047749 RepID=UPI0013040E0E|nr:hypothetical protein [Oceaniglobus indicus]